MTTQAPTIEHRPGDSLADTIERHPAYAQIAGRRVSGDAYLYGSDFRHHHFVTITIARSELHRGLSSDHHFGRDELVEVALSEAQWATFVSSLNMGGGVPCTLLHLDRTPVPDLPAPKSRTQTFSREMGETLQDALTKLAKLRARLVEGKGGKETVKLLDLAVQEIEANVPFVTRQFERQMEAMVEAAKVEVNAYAMSTLTRLGLGAVAQGALETTSEEKST